MPWAGPPALVVQLNGPMLQVSTVPSDVFAHTVRLQQDASNPATQTDVLDGGSIVSTFNNSAFTQISITLGSGNDSIDLGNVLTPSSGITIDGGTSNVTVNGINLQTLTGPTTPATSLVVVNGSEYALAGNSAGGETVWQYNGTGSNWTAITGTNTSVTSLAAANGGLYMLGSNGSSYQTVWRYGGSGMYWPAITGTSTSVASLVEMNGGLYMLATNNVTNETVWQYSGSGSNWTALTGSNTSATALVAANGGLYMLASNGAAYQTVWQYTGSASNWTAITGTNTNPATLVEANGGGLYMLGSNGAAYQTVWQYTGSASNWTALTDTATNAIALVAYQGGLFMLGSNTGDTGETVWQYTGPGSNWTNITTANNALASQVLATLEPQAGAAYSPVSGVLFSPNGTNGDPLPIYQDVQQALSAADCWLLSGLAEVAARDPQNIINMFSYDGTTVENGSTVGIYTVCLYNSNGGAEHVVVDTELPNGGTLYDQPINGVLWVALAEKAYAEANGAGIVISNNMGDNSYDALSYGWSSWPLQAITGNTATNPSFNVTNLVTAWTNGRLLDVLTDTRSGLKVNNYVLTSNHWYAVVGYNANNQMFTLFNPYGVVQTQYPAIVKATQQEITDANVFSYFSKGSGGGEAVADADARQTVAVFTSFAKGNSEVPSANPGIPSMAAELNAGESDIRSEPLALPTAALESSPVGKESLSFASAAANQANPLDTVFSTLGMPSPESPMVWSPSLAGVGDPDQEESDSSFSTDRLTALGVSKVAPRNVSCSMTATRSRKKPPMHSCGSVGVRASAST